jgi:hypothetical protein
MARGIGWILKWPDGHETGPIDGESLRLAEQRGAKRVRYQGPDADANPELTKLRDAIASGGVPTASANVLALVIHDLKERIAKLEAASHQPPHLSGMETR